MGSLAGLLKAAGHDVRGSDEHVYPPMSTQLAEQSIPIFDGFRAENLDWGPDEVVIGNVCRKDHVEVVAAAARNLKLTSFPAVLEEQFLSTRHSLVVAGTHGKTTTSALAASVLVDAGRNPGFLVGGVPQGLGHSFRTGGSDAPFVVEGDEYDTAFFDKGSKFFHYRPRTAILTSVELDHVDIFASLDAVKDAFKKFVALIPPEGLLVVCADDAGAMECAKAARCRVERYSVAGAEAEWRAKPTGMRPGGRTTFAVEHNGNAFGELELGLPGAYNLANALAVIAAVADLGLQAPEIARGVRRFAGVRRRQEVRGVAQGVTVIDDFAHHPTAVRATLAALRGRHGGGKLFAVFEPRSATSRRATFQSEYAEAFGSVDEVIIGAVNAPEKAPEGDRFDPERLAADLRGRGVPARFLATVEQIAGHLAERAAPGDTVVVMSSGGFGNVHDKILDKLGLAVTAARAGDLGQVRALLDRVALPYADLDAHAEELLVLHDGGTVVGCVAMELYDDAGLLRSLAVAPESRGQGLGWMLADAALLRARARGARAVYLTTDNATDFFAEKFGFKRVERSSLSKAMLASSQFRVARADATVTMKLDL
jgi:UDP-N-acetylmuramate: L-alanyl-gamma-D-glutamyl-meso-diaminopimelate ligase